MDHFGAYLKSQREGKGIRLEEIASITKIHLHSLEMLEASRWEALPPEPFIRGFIIAYAKYVGLQPKETLEKYFEATGKSKSDTANATPSIPPTSKDVNRRQPSASSSSSGSGQFDMRTLQPTWIAAGVALVFVAGLVVTLISIGKRESESNGPSPASIEAPAVPTSGTEEITPPNPGEPTGSNAPTTNPSRATASAGVPTPTAPVTPSVAIAPKPVAHEMVVETKERSWIKVVTDDNPPSESFIDPGVRSVFKANDKIKVTLGNAAGAQVLHNGVPTEGTQFMGTIRYFKFPPTARFPQDVRVKRAVASDEATDSAAADRTGHTASAEPNTNADASSEN